MEKISPTQTHGVPRHECTYPRNRSSDLQVTTDKASKPLELLRRSRGRTHHGRDRSRTCNGSRGGNGSVSKDAPSIILQGRSACIVPGPYRADAQVPARQVARSPGIRSNNGSIGSERRGEKEEDARRRREVIRSLSPSFP